MAKLTRSGVLGVVAGLVLTGTTACAQPHVGTGSRAAAQATSDPAVTAPATTGPPASPAGVTYHLSKPLCQAADLSAFKEIFPTDGGTPLAETPTLCATDRLSKVMVLSFSIQATALPTAKSAKWYVDTGRRLARSAPTDISGAGSGAFWTGDKTHVQLVSYYGNLVLTITCDTFNNKQQLPADIQARMARVATGTYARLAS